MQPGEDRDAALASALLVEQPQQVLFAQLGEDFI